MSKLKPVLLAVGATAIVVVCLSATPSTAQANEYYYFGSPAVNLHWPTCGNPCYVEREGSLRRLTESSARTVNGRTVCAATYGTSVVCSDDLAVKHLCSCAFNEAYSRGTYYNPVPQGRAQVKW